MKSAVADLKFARFVAKARQGPTCSTTRGPATGPRKHADLGKRVAWREDPLRGLRLGPDDNRHSGHKVVGKLTVSALRNIDLSFVREESLRTVLGDYYSQATKAFAAKAYIGALVACGSVAEGLLTWALTLRESDALSSGKAPKESNTGQAKPIKTWSLAQLISVAVGLKLIGKTAEGAAWARTAAKRTCR